MSDLRELYQELILDHNKRPRNRRSIDPPDLSAEGFNPLCGDRVTVYVKLDGDRIADVSFEGSGCAISTASSSLMTEALKGKTIAEARAIFEDFHALVTGEADPESAASLGKLQALAGVRDFPTRVKCATLAWHTLCSALEGKQETVSTE